MKLGGWLVRPCLATACLLGSSGATATPPDDDPAPRDGSGWGLPPAEDAPPEVPADEAAPPLESIPDAGASDAGASDAGESDAGASDAGASTTPAAIEPVPPPLQLQDDGGAPNPTAIDPWAVPRPGQLGITVGVPFYDESILHGDMTVDVRYGYKIGWLVPYLSGGFRQTRLDPALVPDHARRKKLEAWHVTLGLRVEIPASKHLFPFVGVAGEMTRWGFQADTTEFCDEPFYPEAWRCYERYRWKPGRAVKPQIGLIYKPEPSLALEFWVEHGTVDAPGMFTRRVTFINPALGFAWHH